MSQILQFVKNTSMVVDTLTGNDGNPVSPNGSGNINVHGVGSVFTFKDPVNPNQIDISVSGGGIQWNDVPTATQQLASNNGYITSHNGQVTFYLPSNPLFGDVVRIIGNNNGGWFIDLTGAGGFFPIGSVICSSTTGTSTVVSVNIADQIELVCLNPASNVWIAATVTGPITIT